jgi:hypothetical protein
MGFEFKRWFFTWNFPLYSFITATHKVSIKQIKQISKLNIKRVDSKKKTLKSKLVFFYLSIESLIYTIVENG